LRLGPLEKSVARPLEKSLEKSLGMSLAKPWRIQNVRWIGATLIILSLAAARSLSAQGYTSNDGIGRLHRDFTGKPCLETKGVSRPLASDPRILDHAVDLENHCFDRIKVKVCYYHTDECTDVEVPGNSRKEQIIGVFPAMQLFRYEVKELF
jgi:hypothetical protein